MARPTNIGRIAWQNNRRRLKEIESELAGLVDRSEELTAERGERQAFNDLCERYANETPADQLQPQAVGSAEQGDGAPSRGDGTPPPIASPCSAETYPPESEAEEMAVAVAGPCESPAAFEGQAEGAVDEPAIEAGDTATAPDALGYDQPRQSGASACHTKTRSGSGPGTGNTIGEIKLAKTPEASRSESALSRRSRLSSTSISKPTPASTAASQTRSSSNSTTSIQSESGSRWQRPVEADTGSGASEKKSPSAKSAAQIATDGERPDKSTAARSNPDTRSVPIDSSTSDLGVQPAAPPNSYPEIPEHLRRDPPAQKA